MLTAFRRFNTGRHTSTKPIYHHANRQANKTILARAQLHSKPIKRGQAMNRYKDTTPKLTTPQGANKPPIKRVIHGLLDCLLMAGMVLFVLILATYCQPARATYENTSQLTYENTSQVSISQAMPKHTAKHCISIV